jgi:hypothetical protein
VTATQRCTWTHKQATPTHPVVSRDKRSQHVHPAIQPLRWVRGVVQCGRECFHHGTTQQRLQRGATCLTGRAPVLPAETEGEVQPLRLLLGQRLRGSRRENMEGTLVHVEHRHSMYPHLAQSVEATLVKLGYKSWQHRLEQSIHLCWGVVRLSNS